MPDIFDQIRIVCDQIIADLKTRINTATLPLEQEICTLTQERDIAQQRLLALEEELSRLKQSLS